jgi:ribulose-phosphate 3-epimerase
LEVADGPLDLALCMSVNPGWGGQKFIAHSLGKLARMRELLPERVALEVDGGIDAQTAASCAQAGAGLFVAGSAVFGAPDPAGAFRRLAEAIA